MRGAGTGDRVIRIGPDTTAVFYRRAFGFGTRLESERLVALDAAGKNVLLLFRTGATGDP
ncbi:hypothetical protein [Gemmata sp. SH-PL17]|uniref:hypothetical protein n=1 Tax=Gemmata sp. SH-PL17 TaxID=1630693 RepID=UPI0006977E3D|nr:hypothetical protein [Gemmata sp. SH-PL17]